MTKIPVGATIAHAYRFAFGNAPAVFKAIWLPLLTQLVLVFLLVKKTALFLAATQAHDPSATGQFGPLMLLVLLIAIFFFAQFAAAMQTALGRPPQSWLTFHFGKPMWRLLGGFVLALVAIVTLMFLYMLCLYALGWLADATLKMSAAAAGRAAVLTAVIAVLLGYGGVIFLVIRFLFLLAPVSIAEQRSGVRRAWQLSAGNFWRALLVTLAIFVPVMIVNYAYVFSLAGLPPMTPNLSKEAREAAEMSWRIAQLNTLAERWYLTLPLTGLLMMFQFGVGCAAQAFAYRALTASETSAPVAGD